MQQQPLINPRGFWIKAAALAACLLLMAALSPRESNAGTAEAILAGGCFWCVEADFDKLPGVAATESGYIGGNSDNPTYKTHSATGHLEAVRITYDPQTVSYRSLLDSFWRSVDVTDDGGQFCDRGNSYRTAVFVASEEQRQIAEASRAAAEEELGQPIKTRILDAGPFWPAEDYHQDFYEKSSLRYKYYRFACGRDARIRELWGDAAFRGFAME